MHKNYALRGYWIEFHGFFNLSGSSLYIMQPFVLHCYVLHMWQAILGKGTICPSFSFYAHLGDAAFVIICPTQFHFSAFCCPLTFWYVGLGHWDGEWVPAIMPLFVVCFLWLCPRFCTFIYINCEFLRHALIMIISLYMWLWCRVSL